MHRQVFCDARNAAGPEDAARHLRRDGPTGRARRARGARHAPAEIRHAGESEGAIALSERSYQPDHEGRGLDQELSRLEAQVAVSWDEERRLLERLGLQNGMRVLE